MSGSVSGSVIVSRSAFRSTGTVVIVGVFTFGSSGDIVLFWSIKLNPSVLFTIVPLFDKFGNGGSVKAGLTLMST